MQQSPAEELNAILTNAAFAPLSDRAFLRITGSDATRWLNGMVTNSIQALTPGQGCYNFLLNAQGRIQGDCTIYRDPASETAEFLLQTTAAQVAPIQLLLDRFIIMDDVELLPIMDDQHALILAGPNASARMTSLSLNVPETTGITRSTYSGMPVIALALHAPLVPLYELWAAPEAVAALRIALDADAVTPVSPEAFEHLRLLSGTPAYGTDIRETSLPQETNQTHALHFSKGCYLGQEIVERIRSRGQLHRTFSGFQLSTLPASLPAALTFDGKAVGELTSAAVVPLSDPGTLFALGYIRREALELSLTRDQPLTFDSGIATPTPLPFNPPERQ